MKWQGRIQGSKTCYYSFWGPKKFRGCILVSQDPVSEDLGVWEMVVEIQVKGTVCECRIWDFPIQIALFGGPPCFSASTLGSLGRAC